MDARALYLHMHARLHTPAVAEAEGGIYLERVALAGLTDEQLRHQPPRMNSIAWNLWHAARYEDALHLIVAGLPMLWDTDGWAARTNVARRDAGVGMTDEETAAFNEAVDVVALREYRAAVGRRTRELVERLAPEDWDRTVDDEQLERAWAAGVLAPERTDWVRGLIKGRTYAFLFDHLGLVHANSHIGEMLAVRGQFDVPVVGGGGFARPPVVAPVI